MKKILQVIRKVFGILPFYCPQCDEFDRTTKRRRQNTAYVDDKLNWVCLCDVCHRENNEYWKERWADYYRGCL